MKLSIVIPSYNMESKIDQCLDSIYSSNADESGFEVIVCDSSTDNSMETYKRWCLKKSNLKIIHAKRRMPCGVARNLAVSKCSGEYVFCLDIDDKLASNDVLKKVIENLDGKDLYACTYISRRDGHVFYLEPKDMSQVASLPVAIWTKIFKRGLWVNEPSYMPEDVWPHFLLLDKCHSYGYFEFPIVDYDNTRENKGAISRTFDFLLNNPTNLLQLTRDDTLNKLGLRDEFVTGVIHNLADMWSHRNDIQQPEVKKEYMKRLVNEYRSFMSGIYVH